MNLMDQSFPDCLVQQQPLHQRTEAILVTSTGGFGDIESAIPRSEKTITQPKMGIPGYTQNYRPLTIILDSSNGRRPWLRRSFLRYLRSSFFENLSISRYFNHGIMDYIIWMNHDEAFIQTTNLVHSFSRSVHARWRRKNPVRSPSW